MENINVKEWYLKAFPTDELGSEINDLINFTDVYKGMKLGLDIYDILQVGDSIIRERVFGQLATILKVDYDHIYKLWLGDMKL